MPLTVSPQNRTSEEKNIDLDRAAKAIIGTNMLAKKLGLKQTPAIFSDAITKFTGSSTLVISGYPEFSGAIKGHAALGYVWFFISSAYEQLIKMEEASESTFPEAFITLSAEKIRFLRERGFKGEIPSDALKKLDCFYLALTNSLKKRPMVCPTSGSFAYSFLQILKILREMRFEFAGQSLSVFAPEEISVIPWIPQPGSDVMPAEKNETISRLAKDLGCKPQYWTEKRDISAFIQTLELGGLYCATNPTSQAELLALTKEALDEKGFIFFATENAKRALSAIGIAVTRDKKITIREPLDASIFGLAVAQLDAVEKILSTGTKIQDLQMFNQPSAGSTLASCALTNLIIRNGRELPTSTILAMQKIYPNLCARITSADQKITTTLYGCFDVANPSLAKRLGYKGKLYANNKKPVNGLGAYSASEASVEWVTEFARAIGSDEKTFGQEYFLICPHNFMEIGRLVLLVAEIEQSQRSAKLPESAAGAGIGAWLHKKYLLNEISPEDLAEWFKEKGLTVDLMWHFIDQKYFLDESRLHGDGMVEFSERFIGALGEKKPSSPHKKENNPATDSQVTIFFNTGSNTPERYKHAIMAMGEQRAHAIFPRSAL